VRKNPQRRKSAVLLDVSDGKSLKILLKKDLDVSILSHKNTTVRASSSNDTKRQKLHHLAPIAFGRLLVTLGKPKTAGIKILLDTGSSCSHVRKRFVNKLRLHRDKAASWNTAAGVISTSETCRVNFSLPEFFPTKTIQWVMHII